MAAHAADGAAWETPDGFPDRIDRVIDLAGDRPAEQRATPLEVAGKGPGHRTPSSEVDLRTRATD